MSFCQLNARSFASLFAIAAFAIAAQTQDSHRTLRDQVHEQGSASGGTASSVIRLGHYGFKEIVNESSLIVEGQVIGAKAHLIDDEKSIVTDNNFEVLQVIKDTKHMVPARQALEVIMPGGEVTIDGAPAKIQSQVSALTPGGLYILFLDPVDHGKWQPISYGVLQVKNNIIECEGSRQVLDLPCKKTVTQFYEAIRVNAGVNTGTDGTSPESGNE